MAQDISASEQVHPQTTVERPPALTLGPIGWLRAHLFNTWYNSLLTILII